MEILLYVIFAFVVAAGIIEMSSRGVYGPYLSNEEVFEFINSYDEFEENPFNPTIISGKIDFESQSDMMRRMIDRRFISTQAIPILSKYYINRNGRVFRWSKASKRIDNLYKNLK